MRVIGQGLGSVCCDRCNLMDAIFAEHDDLSYSDGAPVLVAATSETALQRALRTVEASGARVAAKLAIADAQERIDRQVATCALWIEIDQDCGGAMDALLTKVNDDVAAGRYAAIVSTAPGLLDPVIAQLGDG